MRRKKAKHRKPVGTMNVILALMGIFLLVFIVAMVVIFTRQGTTPDVLITGVFALCGGECGIMGWIKNHKEKAQARKWELEDRERSKRDG